jgi:prepilin peptidase CpaA
MTTPAAPVILLLLLAAHLAVAVYWDVQERRIPNKVVLSGMITALAFHGWVAGLPGLGAAMLGAMTGLLVLLPINLLRLMGAGDVKLMAMAGAFGASAHASLWMVLYTLLAGGLLVVFYATHGQVREKLSSNLFIMLKLGPSELDARGTGCVNKLQSAARLPYAVAIACGSLGYLLFDWL